MLLVSILFFSLILLMTNFFVSFLFIPFILFLFYFFFMNISFFSLNYVNFFLVFLSFWLIYFIYLFMPKLSPILLSFLLIFVVFFFTKNFLLFFILFELSLIPTYLLVIQGTTPERSFASNYLILYTFMGGLPLFFSVVISFLNSSLTFCKLLQFLDFIPFLLLILSFLMKLPIFFFHLWLPKAHVEASTPGSMILAGVLLKLGSYGLILFLPFFAMHHFYLSIFVCFGGIYSGIFSFIQKDFKSLIAYSSIIHMSLIVFCSFGEFESGLLGCTFMSVGHGFMSANMFFLFSFLYKVTNSRNIFFLKSLAQSYFFFVFLLSFCLMLNSAAPFSLKFFSELFLFCKMFPLLNFWSFIMIFLMNVLGGLLSIFFFLSVYHGSCLQLSFCNKMLKNWLSFFMSYFCVWPLILFQFCL